MVDYNDASLEEILHEFAVVRGDLTEKYARDQLRRIIHQRIGNAYESGRIFGQGQAEKGKVELKNTLSIQNFPSETMRRITLINPDQNVTITGLRWPQGGVPLMARRKYQSERSKIAVATDLYLETDGSVTATVPDSIDREYTYSTLFDIGARVVVEDGHTIIRNPFIREIDLNWKISPSAQDRATRYHKINQDRLRGRGEFSNPYGY